MTKKKRLTHKKHGRVIHTCECPTCRQHPNGRMAREHRALNRLIAAADERTRRLIAGFLASTAAAVSPCWPASPGLIAIPSPAVDVNCASLSGGRGGSDVLVQGASALKKKPRSREGPGGVPTGHGGRRPELRPEVDSSLGP